MEIAKLELRGTEGRATLQNDATNRRVLVAFDDRPADIELFYGCDIDDKRRAAGVILRAIDGAGAVDAGGDCLRLIEQLLP